MLSSVNHNKGIPVGKMSGLHTHTHTEFMLSDTRTCAQIRNIFFKEVFINEEIRFVSANLDLSDLPH